MALVAPAIAADLTPPPPPPPPPPLWTGFYIGVNAGYEWSASQSNDLLTTPVFGTLLGAFAPPLALAATANSSLQSSGFIGGGQVGYNYQLTPNFVAGIEADLDGIAGANRSSSLTNVSIIGGLPFTTNLFEQESVRYLGTVRGRFGFLVTPTLLAYGTGGLAYGGVENTSIISQSALPIFGGLGVGRTNTTHVGWTAGGGAEWMFLPNWSAKVEYLYYSLGDVNTGYTVDTLAGAPFILSTLYATAQNRTRVNGNIVRVGIDYHFNWAPKPVVAKY